MRNFPADGTFIKNIAGDVFRFAGGAPLYVFSWDNVGGWQASTLIDHVILDGNGSESWKFETL